MWRIIGLCFFQDRSYFVDQERKTYRLEELQTFLQKQGIALFDTCLRVRRTKGTASDKDLEVIEKADLEGMLQALPECRAVLTAGQLATNLFSEHFGIHTKGMKMGTFVPFKFQGRTLRLYREPSSSRAYPMKLENKAAYYQQMFNELEML